MRKPDSLQRKEGILVLVQRIAELPRVQKKVLAMYYFENMSLADIAACLGLSKARTCQILIRTVDLLQSCLLQTRQNATRKGWAEGHSGSRSRID
jgi:RNA polymerase sigma factor for flagellar operon FliA